MTKSAIALSRLVLSAQPPPTLPFWAFQCLPGLGESPARWGAPEPGHPRGSFCLPPPPWSSGNWGSRSAQPPPFLCCHVATERIHSGSWALLRLELFPGFQTKPQRPLRPRSIFSPVAGSPHTSSYHGPHRARLCSMRTLQPPLIPRLPEGGSCHYSDFINGETELWRSDVTCGGLTAHLWDLDPGTRA
jgi:hypothetical protein